MIFRKFPVRQLILNPVKSVSMCLVLVGLVNGGCNERQSQVVGIFQTRSLRDPCCGPTACVCVESKPFLYLLVSCCWCWWERRKGEFIFMQNGRICITHVNLICKTPPKLCIKATWKTNEQKKSKVNYTVNQMSTMTF